MDVESTLSKMTPEEKIALCSGADFWHTKPFEKHGIPQLSMCDGPHGLRKQENAGDLPDVSSSRQVTCFPAEVTAASSWDVPLLERVGAAVAEEAAEQRVGLVLGPGANLKRNPLCGRNFEYFSEDPYLTGKLAAAFIRGVESKGVGTCLKHFACNSQEKDRFTSDSVMDGRTLRELYLAGFETAVKEGRPSSVMCAYPKLNGVHCSDSAFLLTDVLRREWGFEGAVVTDWGAMNDRIAGFRAGCDLNMPGGSAYMEKEALAAVKSGALSGEALNASAERVLRLVLRGAAAMTGEACDYDAHHRLSLEAAVSGAVLLQNRDRLLPLKRSGKLAVVGDMAERMRFQGSGSSHINPVKLSQPLGFLPPCAFAPGCDENGGTTPELLEEVKRVCAGAEAVVVFAGLPGSYESEGFDRSDMKLPEGHVRMIAAAAEANPNVAVVLFAGSAVECPWADSVKSILYMGLPGQAGGEAAARLLFGDAVPSGRLAESWPFRYEDVPSSALYGKTRDALYEEGLYVGYRYYDKAGVPVRWPFGYGLSYTDFTYSGLSVSGDTVTVTVTNAGACDGAEVVQLYVGAPQDGLHRPLRELKGFRKIFLKKGESRELRFVLDERSFAVYADGWVVPGGRYSVEIGGLTAYTEKPGVSPEIPPWQAGSFYERCAGKPSQSEWEAMLGRPYAPAPLPEKGDFTMESTAEEMSGQSFVMRLLCAVIRRMFLKRCGNDPDSPEFKMLTASSLGAPLRSMYISGGVRGGVFPGLLDMANGRFFRGLGRMLRG